MGRRSERKQRRELERQMAHRAVMTLNNDGKLRPMWSKEELYSTEFGEMPENPLSLSELEAARGLRLRLLLD